MLLLSMFCASAVAYLLRLFYGMTLFQSHCQQLTVDADDCFPAQSVQLVINDAGTSLCWSLHYLHDRLQKKGETRQFFKWANFFKTSVDHTDVHDEDHLRCIVHIRGHTLPPGALDETVASSEAVLAYFLSVLNTGRKPEIIAEVDLWLMKITNRIVEESTTNAVDIQLDAGFGAVRFRPQAGTVEGLQAIVVNRHRTALESWGQLWQLMHQHDHLAGNWSVAEPLGLRDVVKFAFKCVRFRRSLGKPIWQSSSPSGQCLVQLQRAVIRFLSDGLYDYVNGKYQESHDVSKAAPSRRLSRSSSGFKMPVENIWDVLDHAQTTGKNARQALQFCKSRLSNAGGCHENSADAWVRRRQILYDNRLVSSMCGASHYNLVADTSKHSGREVLVSVIFAHETASAAVPSLQCILPCDSIGPGELDLTTLVEQLAKETILICKLGA